MSMSNNNGSLIENLKNIFRLYVTDVKLSAAEKLSHGLAVAAILFAGAFLGLGAMLFLSVALALLLSELMGLIWACVTIAVIYGLLITLIVLFRRTLVDDPITRMVTSLMLDAPETPAATSTSITKPNGNESK